MGILRCAYALQLAPWRKVFCTGLVDILQTMLPAFVALKKVIRRKKKKRKQLITIYGTERLYMLNCFSY